MAIPRIVHYCWFGGKEMPSLVKKCINSWKKYLQGYEFRLWDERNFDVTINRYVEQAYKAKKYAFVADYVRLYALYHYGGIYLDTDVELLKPLDRFLSHRAFTGCESEEYCVTGVMGAEKHHPWIETLLEYYENREFIKSDGSYDLTPNTQIITKLTIEKYNWIPSNVYQELKDGLVIYPTDFFCPKDLRSRKLRITENTVAIHHFAASWLPLRQKVRSRVLSTLRKFLGERFYEKLRSYYRSISKRQKLGENN